jgi:hypothetical protein
MRHYHLHSRQRRPLDQRWMLHRGRSYCRRVCHRSVVSNQGRAAWPNRNPTREKKKKTIRFEISLGLFLPRNFSIADRHSSDYNHLKFDSILPPTEKRWIVTYHCTDTVDWDRYYSILVVVDTTVGSISPTMELEKMRRNASLIVA